MEKVSVFLADWQVLFREGIHFTLSGEEDIDVIGEATSNDEVYSFIENNTPAIAVLNANSSDFTGISLTRHIRQNLPSVSVILIMDNEDDETQFSALKCGASACITKNISPEEMVDLIRKVAQGSNPIRETLLMPQIAPRVIEEFENLAQLSKEVDNMLAPLSTEESEILRCVAEGNTIGKVSTILEISEENIKHRLDAVLIKLVNNDRCREVIEATQRNLPAIITRTKRGVEEPEYVSKEEFDAFKESIKERFKTFLNGLG
jgi:DNA-binding NarL/FixJ family response regulator